MLAWGLSGHIYFAQMLFPRKIATLGALVFILVSVHACVLLELATVNVDTNKIQSIDQ